jgi:hypothetical protein
MSEGVFSITRSAGKTTRRFVGKTGHKLGPGDPAVLIPRSQLDQQLVADVNKAPPEFDSVPALPRDIAAGIDPLQLAVNALAKGANDRDTDFDWELTPVVGASGVTSLEIVAVCKDTDHANTPTNHVLDGRRITLTRTVGSATFDTVGGPASKVVTIRNGRGVATLVVAAPITQAQTITMTDSDATGLTLPAAATVTFNA